MFWDQSHQDSNSGFAAIHYHNAALSNSRAATTAAEPLVDRPSY
jgi:hypothetical protein